MKPKGSETKEDIKKVKFILQNNYFTNRRAICRYMYVRQFQRGH